jgi:hypothetical protein
MKWFWNSLSVSFWRDGLWDVADGRRAAGGAGTRATPGAARDRHPTMDQLLRGLQLTMSMLFLTATPPKGDPESFRLFLQLLNRDAFADIRSIREAMNRRNAPFYLRRTKEAMVYFV